MTVSRFSVSSSSRSPTRTSRSPRSETGSWPSSVSISILPTSVLADIDMPKRDGYEVAAYVKSRPKLAHIPVVLLTGAFEPIDQVRAKAAGSSDVLAKPFEPQMVINRVKELLGRKRQEPASEVAAPEPPPPPSAPQPSQTVAPTVAPAPVAPPVAAKSAPPAVEPPPQPAPGPAASGAKSASDSAAQPVSLDDYFDQLDAAFSNIQPGAPADDASDGMDWPLMTPASQGDAGSAPVVEKRQTPAPTGPVAVPMASAPKPVAVPPPASAFAPSSLIASADKSAGAPASPIARRTSPRRTCVADRFHRRARFADRYGGQAGGQADRIRLRAHFADRYGGQVRDAPTRLSLRRTSQSHLSRRRTCRTGRTSPNAPSSPFAFDGQVRWRRRCRPSLQADKPAAAPASPVAPADRPAVAPVSPFASTDKSAAAPVARRIRLRALVDQSARRTGPLSRRVARYDGQRRFAPVSPVAIGGQVRRRTSRRRSSPPATADSACRT